MSTDKAELSSIGSAVTDLLGRISEMAERWHAAERDDVAKDLFEVERALRTAERRIQRASKAIGD